MSNIVNTTPDIVLGKLLQDRRRQIYTAADGSLWIDYQGGAVAPDTIPPLVATGAIVPVVGVDGLWVLGDEPLQS